MTTPFEITPVPYRFRPPTAQVVRVESNRDYMMAIGAWLMPLLASGSTYRYDEMMRVLVVGVASSDGVVRREYSLYEGFSILVFEDNEVIVMTNTMLDAFYKVDS